MTRVALRSGRVTSPVHVVLLTAFPGSTPSWQAHRSWGDSFCSSSRSLTFGLPHPCLCFIFKQTFILDPGLSASVSPELALQTRIAEPSAESLQMSKASVNQLVSLPKINSEHTVEPANRRLRTFGSTHQSTGTCFTEQTLKGGL